MKYLLIVILYICVSIYPQVQKTETEKENTHKFDPSRNPGQDLKEAVKEATKSGKRILLDVGGEWCIWCHRLDQFFEDNVEINKYLQDNFIIMKVNYSPENKNEKFLSQYPKVAGYPHLFVLEKNGKFLHSQNTGDLEKGKGHDPEKILAFLQKWAPENKRKSEK